MKKILVKIKNGEIKVEATGFRGTECEKATEYLRRHLGDEIATDLKPTYYFGEEEEQDKICFEPFCG